MTGAGTQGVSSPRVLSDLFWMGRYGERAENMARLLIVTRERYHVYRHYQDTEESECVPVLMGALGRITGLSPTATFLGVALPAGASHGAVLALGLVLPLVTLHAALGALGLGLTALLLRAARTVRAVLGAVLRPLPRAARGRLTVTPRPARAARAGHARPAVLARALHPHRGPPAALA